MISPWFHYVLSAQELHHLSPGDTTRRHTAQGCCHRRWSRWGRPDRSIGKVASHLITAALWVWIKTYENTMFRGMNIHKSQLFWYEQKGYKVLTHCHVCNFWRNYQLYISDNLYINFCGSKKHQKVASHVRVFSEVDLEVLSETHRPLGLSDRRGILPTRSHGPFTSMIFMMIWHV